MHVYPQALRTVCGRVEINCQDAFPRPDGFEVKAGPYSGQRLLCQGVSA